MKKCTQGPQNRTTPGKYSGVVAALLVGVIVDVVVTATEAFWVKI